MEKAKLLLVVLLILSIQNTKAQTYVGEVLYRDRYQYIKITYENASAKFEIPYLDAEKKYDVKGDLSSGNLLVDRGVEQWKFKINTEGNHLNGELALPSGTQKINIRQQIDPIGKEELQKYKGVYRDEQNRRVIIYERSNYLQFMSPYTEETMSLKPIGEHEFWSTSGESSLFSELDNNSFRTLTICDRSNQKFILTRVAPILEKELWIPIGKDTLYGRLFLPSSNSPIPACLVLPGGGAIGIDNYEYEARYLAGYGVASLIFDKSGNGKSKGSGNFQLQTFEEKNNQYKVLFRYLQKYPGIDPTKVGIHGPSEGGRLALMMAIDLQDTVAFVNATAAPLMTLVDGQLYAMHHHHRNMGVSEIDNAKIQELWYAYYQEIAKGKIEQKTVDGFNKFRKKNGRLFIPGPSTQVPASPTKDDLYNDRVVKQAGKITAPLLLQYGENDERVDRVKSLQNFLPELDKKASVNTLIYERGSHSFMTPEFKICTGYVDDKIKWLKSIGVLE